MSEQPFTLDRLQQIWPEIRAQGQEFWALVVEVWQEGVFGVDIGRVMTALMVLLAFLGLRKLITRFLLHEMAQLAERTETRFDDKIIRGIKGPVSFVPIVAGIYFAGQTLGLEEDLAFMVDGLVRSLIAITIFWALHNAISQISNMLTGLRRVLTDELLEWLVKALRAGIILIGAATVLEIWGIAVGPIIAGLGLFGVAVALGAQDLFKNLIAGVLVLTEKRFQRGDWILVDGIVEGTVEKINFRSTLVRRFDKAPVYVPNAFLSDNAVTNFTKMTFRRIRWFIGVEYRTSHDQLVQIRDAIEAYILGNSEFAHPPEVTTFVRLEGFGASSIDFQIYAFTRTTQWTEWLRIREALAFEIKRIVEGAGTAFAFPSTSLYVESVPTGERPALEEPSDAGSTAAILPGIREA